MAENTEVMVKMNMAADAAEAEFRSKLASLASDEQQLVLYAAHWMANNYMSAGYKRLGKILTSLVK